MSIPLFREEALRARLDTWTGPVVLSSPLSFKVATVAALLVCSAVVSVVVYGSLPKKTTVVGALVPAGGVHSQIAPQAATVLDTQVREGTYVRRGDLLLRLKSERFTSRGELHEMVESTLNRRREGLEQESDAQYAAHQHRLQALLSREISLRKELAQAQDEERNLLQRQELGRASLRTAIELHASGFAPKQMVDQRQDELLELAARIGSAQRAALAIDRDLRAIPSERQLLQSQLQATLAQIKRSLAGLEQETAEANSRGALEVRASADGQVILLDVKTGQSIAQGQHLITLATGSTLKEPSNSRALVAHFYAPSTSIGLIREGQQVLLKFPAFPYQKYGALVGKVEAVSRSSLAPSEIPPAMASMLVNALNRGDMLFRVSVALEKNYITVNGDRIPLVAGIRVDGDIILERRKVWEWFVEPLMALRSRTDPFN